MSRSASSEMNSMRYFSTEGMTPDAPCRSNEASCEFRVELLNPSPPVPREHEEKEDASSTRTHVRRRRDHPPSTRVRLVDRNRIAAQPINARELSFRPRRRRQRMFERSDHEARTPSRAGSSERRCVVVESVSERKWLRCRRWRWRRWELRVGRGSRRRDQRRVEPFEEAAVESWCSTADLKSTGQRGVLCAEHTAYSQLLNVPSRKEIGVHARDETPA